ncbi:SPOSA6832_03834, partial [Sporobolomyces salmonicolor]
MASPNLQTVPSNRTSSARSAPSSSLTASRNPLQLKVNRLLSSNLDDAGTRAALDTLGQIEQGGLEPNGRAIGSALKRGGLRKEIDGRMAQGSKEFLEAFSEVNDKLSMLQSHLDAMHVCCDEVQTELDKANQGTRYLLEHAEGLRQQRFVVPPASPLLLTRANPLHFRSTTAVQQSLVHLFLTRFTLSDAELRALTSREVPVGPELFAAMDKTERIRADCKALLSGEAGEGTQAGLDIMEYTSQHLEAGYLKIFKWCSFEARGFAKDVLEVSVSMRTAVARLKSRPDLLSCVLSLTILDCLPLLTLATLCSEVLAILGTTRSTSILNLFLDALTRGGPNGLPRPIELHAHDPIRYIGDMLAWIHQAMAGEREFLESLFGVKEEGRWVGSVHGYSTLRSRRADEIGGESDQERVKRLLDKDFEGCGRPLKIRVQQTIKSQESSIMAYRIATLIHFYKVTMERTIGEDALMSKVLTEIMDHAYEVFFETLKAQGRSLLRFIQPPAAALSAPTQLRDTLSTLREIMSVYSHSLLDSESPSSPSASPSDFKPVLDAVLDPALQMCGTMAEMRATEWDRAVFWVNCDEAVLGVLEGYRFAEERRRAVESDEEGHVERLTVEHYGHLLKETGLEPILEALHGKDADTPLSHIPAAGAHPLMQAISLFSTFLSTVDTLSSPRLSLLPPHLASSIHAEALARISRAYDEVYNAVTNEKNRYEGRNTLLRRSKEEVATLLGS